MVLDGVQVLARCPVEQICVEDGKVTGVRLAGKHPMRINCSTVVSAAGFLETLGEQGLLPTMTLTHAQTITPWRSIPTSFTHTSSLSLIHSLA